MPRGVEVITVSGERDFFAPDAVTRLQGARHLTLPTTHTGLLVDPNVADTIDQLLDPRAAAARAVAAATNGTKADPPP